jgi:hypothetical protein
MKYIIIIGVVWIIFALLTYSMSLAFFQNEYPMMAESRCRKEMGMSVLFAILSPVSTVVVFLLAGFAEHGFQLVCNKDLGKKMDKLEYLFASIGIWFLFWVYLNIYYLKKERDCKNEE